MSQVFQVEPLLSWYRNSARDIPWRLNPNPYWVWLGEVMSQQTSLSVVIPRFKSFVEVLPTVQSLSLVSDEILTPLWQGLGYYARARNLKKGALYIVRELDAKFPTSYEGWLQVPGCGPYTAAMVSSMIFSCYVSSLDGNALRVGARVLGLDTKMWTKEGIQNVKKWLDNMIRDTPHPGEFNQAIMEIGALLCRKSNPSCSDCPLRSNCVAFASKNTILPAKPRKEKINVHLRILVLHRSDSKEIALVRRESGFLSGTVGFPIEIFDCNKPKDSDIFDVGQFSHTITHHKISCEVWSGIMEEAAILKVLKSFRVERWVPVNVVSMALSASLDVKAWGLAKRVTAL